MKKYGVLAAAAVMSVCGLAQAQVFSSAPGLAIADNTTISDTISVSGGPTSLTGMTLTLNITHTFDGDLDIALVHNDQFIILSTDNGGAGENFLDTIFDDAAGVSITAGAAPFAGAYTPEGGFVGWNGVPTPPATTQFDTFSAFNGQDANGGWTLIVHDDAGLDQGVLNSWSLTLNGPTSGPTNPFGVGAASATTEVGTTLMTVTVTGGQNPPSTGLSVSANLSNVGGSTQALYNDGTNGDVSAGDNIWSYSYTLPNTVVSGAYGIPFTVSDAQSRSTSSTMGLTIANGPGGACCNSGCTITRETLCVGAGGAFQGAGTNCGVGYTITTGTNAFEDISTTGVMLATVSNVDDGTESVALPFAFTHLGNSYSSVNVCSNGNLQFSTNSTAWVNATIPTAAVPNDMLAPLWDDYDLNDLRNGPGLGAVYTLDDSANGRFIISWQGVGQYNIAQPVLDANDFQVILYSNGNAEFRYGNVPTVLNPLVAGDFVTIGYENIDGTDGGSVDPASAVGAGNVSLLLTASNTNPCSPACDTIDFNGDGLFPDTDDISQFILVFGGGACPTGTCGDIDYNNDGLFPDTLDISALISVFGGGDCLR